MNKGYSICMNEWALDVEIKNELPLLLIVSSLCAEKGYCFASNEYLAELFKTNDQVISRKLKKLEAKGYITIEYQYYGSKVDKRFIRLPNLTTIAKKSNGTIAEISNGTIAEKGKDNITSINNTSINKQRESELEVALKEFTLMRKSIKKPLTDNAKKRLMSRLDEMAQSDQEKIAILNQSIDHCWQDIYPLKKKIQYKEAIPEEEKEDINEVIRRIESSRSHH